MDVWFPLNNPIKPCSVHEKICSYTATTNIKIAEIIPFTEKINVKNRTFIVSMDVMSLDTNIQQKKDLSKEKPRESYEKNSSKTTFEENNSNLKKKRSMDGGYPQSLIENLLSEIKFTKGSLNS